MNKLTEIIKYKIKDAGSITFAEFMDLALYHPTYGYYTTGKSDIGKHGDFYTSPHVHSAFGSVIGNFILRSFQLLDEDRLTIVEIGAGKGFLALDILDHIKTQNHGYYERLNYYIVERNNYSKKESEGKLKDHLDQIKWFSDIGELANENIKGVLISNELFDALPFHRLKYTNGDIAEIYVTLENGELAEALDKPSNNYIEKYLKNTGIKLLEGQEFEINPSFENLLKQINETLQKGFILSIDYGYLAPELFSPDRMKGTYKCIYRHKINEQPYTNVGEQDITAHVDFSNLIKVGESLGLNKVHYTSQGQFLIDWGILDFVNNSNEKEIQALKNLFLPELMGDKFKILIQEKMGRDLKDFYPESPFKISFNVL